jgi:hypothetical protein
MDQQSSGLWGKFQEKWLSRRSLLHGAAGAVLGAGFSGSAPIFADENDSGEPGACAITNPIPGGITPFRPFGVVVHHNPLSPTNQMAVGNISDPSQITDFDGFVGLTHIRGGGTGTDTTTGATTSLGFQADMGFSQGKFIGIDGRLHKGTFAFV